MFVDDDDSPYEESIERLAAAGITTGCGPAGDRTFCPEDPVSRASFAVFLDRALDLPDAEMSFEDVAPAGVSAPSIARLAAAGIVQGCGPTTFCPAQSVTRGQAAVFLDRALDLPDERLPFADVSGDGPIGAAIERLNAAGILPACEEVGPQFCPDQLVTRAEVAELLVRAELVG